MCPHERQERWRQIIHRSPPDRKSDAGKVRPPTAKSKKINAVQAEQAGKPGSQSFFVDTTPVDMERWQMGHFTWSSLDKNRPIEGVVPRQSPGR
jgi:hypothetical protein